MAEALEIPWKNDESYDDWEAVEESLFRHFVVTPLLFDVNPKTINQFVQYKSAPKNLSVLERPKLLLIHVCCKSFVLTHLKL